MSRRKSSFLRWLVEPEPPGLGLDLRSNELVVARLTERRGVPELDLALAAPVPSGLVQFSMLTPNIEDAEAFARLLETTLFRAGLGGSGRIALSLPDYLARIAIVELPEVPRSRDEIAELLKFRLKKSLPFDVEHARLAFNRVPGEDSRFLTGVMHESVVAQYEEILGRLGFHVGLVVPSSASLLGLLKPIAFDELAPGADYFFVNVEQEYFTVTLVRDREVPVLTRTLGLRSNEAGPAVYGEEDLLQEIIPTALYYREKLNGGSLERVYYRSLRPDLVHLRELLEGQFEAPTEPFNLVRAVQVAKDLELDADLADAVGAACGVAVGRVA